MNQPRSDLTFRSCAGCLDQPCGLLRFGGVCPGKFVFIRPDRMVAGADDCPFRAQSFREIRFRLEMLAAGEIVRRARRALECVSPLVDTWRYQMHFVNGSADAAGYLALLAFLWNRGDLAAVRVPTDYLRDARLRAWLMAYESWMPERVPEQEEQAATDESQEDAEEESSPVEQVIIAVRLMIDPESPEADDDTFTLISTDANKSYRRTLTVRDDKVAGDDCVDLEFTECPSNLSYTLEWDPGREGKPFAVFRDTPYREL